MTNQFRSIFRLFQITLLFATRKVTGSISWAIIPEDTIAKEGLQTTLFCKIHIDGEPTHVISWIINPKQAGKIVAGSGISVDDCCTVSNDTSNGESNLVIRNTTKSLGGEWECNVGGLGKKNATLFVIGSNEPHCSKTSGIGLQNEAIVGNVIELTCSVESILPQSAKLVWMRDNKIIQEEHSNQSSYKVQVEKEDHGVTFSCELQHRSIKSSLVCSDKITLDVQYKPTVNVPSHSCVNKDTHKQLNCKYVPGNPSFTKVKWITTFGDTVIRDNPLIINDIDALLDYPVNYTCIVSNTFFDGTHGKDEGVTMIHVQYKPIVRSPAKHTVKEGDVLQINCSVKSEPSANEIKWTTPSGDTYQGNTVTLLNVSRGHAGSYTCSATNKFCGDIGGHWNATSSTLVYVECDGIIWPSTTNLAETSFTEDTTPKQAQNIEPVKGNAEWNSIGVLIAAICCVIAIVLLVVVILVILILRKHRKNTLTSRKLQCSYELSERGKMTGRSQPRTRSCGSRDDQLKDFDAQAVYVTPDKVRKQKYTASACKLILYKRVPTCGSAGQERPFSNEVKKQVADHNSQAGFHSHEELYDSNTEDCNEGCYELLNEPLPPRSYGPQYENIGSYLGKTRTELHEEAGARANSQILRHGPIGDEERSDEPAKCRHYENLKRNENIDRAEERSDVIRTQVKDLLYAELDLSHNNQSPTKRTPRVDECSQYSSIDHVMTEKLRQDKKKTATKF